MTQQDQIALTLPPEVQKIVTHFEEKYGIQLGSILQDTTKNVKEKGNEVASTIIGAVWSRIEESYVQRGAKYIPTETDQQVQKMLENRDFHLQPSIARSQEKVNGIKRLRGGSLVSHLEDEMAAFKRLADAVNEDDYVKTLLKEGITAIGVPMFKATNDAIKLGNPLKAAMLAGVVFVGLLSAIAFASIILGFLLQGFLQYLAASIMGIAFNETAEPLIVKNWRNGLFGGPHDSDLWVRYGHMTAFTMEDSINNGTNGEEEVFLPPALDFGSEGGLQCSCGYICADQSSMFVAACDYVMRITTYKTNRPIYLQAMSSAGGSNTGVNLNTPPGASLEQISSSPTFDRDYLDGLEAQVNMDMPGHPGHRTIAVFIYPTHL